MTHREFAESYWKTKDEELPVLFIASLASVVPFVPLAMLFLCFSGFACLLGLRFLFCFSCVLVLLVLPLLPWLPLLHFGTLVALLWHFLLAWAALYFVLVAPFASCALIIANTSIASGICFKSL